MTADAVATATITIVYDDYMVAAADAGASYTITTATALDDVVDAANTANNLTFVIDMGGGNLTQGDTIVPLAVVTDVATNTVDASADTGTAGAATAFTIN